MPLLGLNGHGLLHRKRLLLTQSRHQACLNDPHVNRYDPPVQNTAGTARASEGCDTVRLSALAVSRVPAN